MTTNDPNIAEEFARALMPCKHEFFGRSRRCGKCAERCPGCNGEEGVLCETCNPGITGRMADAMGAITGLSEARTLQVAPPAKQIWILIKYRHSQDQEYLPVPKPGGWKVDEVRRLLIIGRGLDRLMIPLENIEYFGPRDKKE